MRKHNKRTFLIGSVLIAGLLTGCSQGASVTSESTVSASLPSKGHQEAMEIEDRILSEYVDREVNAFVSNDDLIMEQHEITKVEDGWIHGENVNGSGEGIYYQESYFELKGVTVEVGDVVEIYWEKADIAEENWEVIYALKKL